MPTNSDTVLLLLLITMCAVLHESSKKHQCRYTSFQYPLKSKVTIFIDSNYVMR